MSLSASGFAEVLEIKPKYDYSTYFNSSNYTSGVINSSLYGGSAGAGPSSSYKQYEKFLLPSYVAGTSVSSAIFDISYVSIFNSNRDIKIYAVDNNWEASSLFNSAGPDAKEEIGSLPQGGYSHAAVDLTEFVNGAYQRGDGAVGFVIMSKWGFTNFNDAINIGREKYLNVTLTSAVPEPSGYAMTLLGLGLLGFVAQRSARRKSAEA
ncbi:DNRLRE domain-containing protein [Janthinobacterium sp. MP5059B]|uniref:DNRLRE domain-containing protein n=1 Tax=Janthinobacterium sp. MP5059B TaxID=1766683 RepID=UPI0015860646|nr:DNRLRE domain-containing protein [Janthinobacterium sp. MP5059B]